VIPLIEKEITITLEHGIHARPAADLVKSLSRFQSDILFYHRGKEYNAKSILSMMSAAIGKGQTIRVVVDGVDEEEAFTYLGKSL